MSGSFATKSSGGKNQASLNYWNLITSLYDILASCLICELLDGSDTPNKEIFKLNTEVMKCSIKTWFQISNRFRYTSAISYRFWDTLIQYQTLWYRLISEPIYTDIADIASIAAYFDDIHTKHQWDTDNRLWDFKPMHKNFDPYIET